MRLLIVQLATLFCIPVFGAVDHWETAVNEDDLWRYLVPSTTVPSTWNTLGFNDASWSQGPGGFGYGDGDDNTTFVSTISCFQRIAFNIADVSAIDMAVLDIDFDDGFIAYLNGVEIARYNVSNGQEGYNNLASGQHEAQMYGGGMPTQFILDNAFIQANLLNGNNVLCIQTHNATAGSSDMSSRTWLSLGINNASNNYGPTPNWFNPPLIFTESNLPIVVINTVGGQTIPDEPKIDAVMGIIYNGEGQINNINDPFNEYSGNIGIEIRGSSSQMFPKKGYGFETRDNFGESHDVTMFNMAYDNDWVLYAPYSDKSLIRNVLAYSYGWDLGQYAPRTKLCEVVLNGDYIGVYVLTEKIKRKDGKVGFDDVEPNENTGNELTGDYILKVDKFTAGGILAWTSPFPPYPGSTQYHNFQLHDPPWDSLTPTQKNYIQNHITNFETALNGPNFDDPILGYKPYIDAQSFINFLLVNEMTKNVDGYRISSYLHKLRTSDGGKIVAGPLWDFNLAIGNANYCAGGNTTGWELDFYQQCSGDGWQNPFWWKKLLQDPEYAHDANCTWQQMRLGAWHDDSLVQRIDDLALYLDQAQQRNFQRWPILSTYVWPNNNVGGSYQAEIEYLKQWLLQRASWMDANMFGSCADLGIEENITDRIEVFPNPAGNYVQISFGQNVSEGMIEILDTKGKTILTKAFLDTELLSLGLNINPGVYYVRIVYGEHRSIQKLIVQD